MQAIDARAVNARMERLPYCSWHTRLRLIICTAWFTIETHGHMLEHLAPAQG